jgi:4a-hydroxytetrahydrobiopterin dehydratase
MAVELSEKHCVPCEGGVPPMTNEDEDRYIKEVPSWTLDREGIHKIKKSFKFKDFKEAMKFVNEVARLAEEEGHHPNIHIYYNRVEFELYTRAIGGLFENDFIMAAKIDRIKV